MREKDISTLKAEADAMRTLSQNADVYNRQVNWRGANTETQFMSNLARQVDYQRLLNVQLQRGFFTPQQDYAWRQQELAQRLNWNRAIQQGYQTPDQFLGYLAAQRSAMVAENAAWAQRAALLKAATDAQTGLSSAVVGTHLSTEQLASGTDRARLGLAALGGIPVSPVATLSDSQLRGAVAIDTVILDNLGRMVARPRVEVSGITESAGDIAAIEAALDRLRVKFKASVVPLVAEQPQIALTGGTNVGAGPPPVATDSAIAADRAVINARILEAYRELVAQSGDFIRLSALRRNLLDISRTTLDAALIQLYKQQQINLVPQDNQQALTEADRAAALPLGGEQKHQMSLTSEFGEASFGVVSRAAMFAAEMQAAEIADMLQRIQASVMGVSREVYAEIQAMKLALQTVTPEFAKYQVSSGGVIDFTSKLIDGNPKLELDATPFYAELTAAMTTFAALNAARAEPKLMLDASPFRLAIEASVAEITWFSDRLQQVELRAIEESKQLAITAGGEPSYARYATSPSGVTSGLTAAQAEAAAAAVSREAAATAELARFQTSAAGTTVELTAAQAAEAKAADDATAAYYARKQAAQAEADRLAGNIRDTGAAFDYEAARSANASKFVVEDEEKQAAGAQRMADAFLKTGMSSDEAAAKLTKMAQSTADAANRQLYMQAALIASGKAAKTAADSTAQAAAEQEAAAKAAADESVKGSAAEQAAEAKAAAEADKLRAAREASRQAAAAEAVASEKEAGSFKTVGEAAAAAEQAIKNNTSAIYSSADAINLERARQMAANLTQGDAAKSADDTTIKYLAAAAAAGKVSDSYNFMSAATARAAADAGKLAAAAGGGAGGAGGAMAALAGGNWWGALNRNFSAFNGAVHTVSLWHIALDALIETLAVWVPALSVAAAGLAAFGVLATQSGDSLGRIKDHLTGLQTATSATGQQMVFQATSATGALTHLGAQAGDVTTKMTTVTSSFDQLQKTVRPQVWQLYGDAIDAMAGGAKKTITDLGLTTGNVLDRMAARIEVAFTSPKGQAGIQAFVASGERDIAGLAKAFSNLGTFFLSLIQVSQKTHIAEYLLAIGDAVTHVFKVIGELIQTPLGGTVAAWIIGLHGLYVWSGLIATGFAFMLEKLIPFAAKIPVVGDALVAFSYKMSTLSAAQQKWVNFGVFGVAALTAFIVWVEKAKDATQTWADSQIANVNKANPTNMLGTTVAALNNVSAAWDKAKATGSADAQYLGSTHATLLQDFTLESERLTQISQLYGVSLPGAMALANAAGIKVSDFTDTNNSHWATSLQMIAGMVTGYQNMGQQGGLLGGDLNALSVTTSDQVSAVQKLNTAWQTWFSTVTGGQTTVATFSTSYGTFTTDLKNSKSTYDTVNTDFQTLITNGQQLVAANKTAGASQQLQIKAIADTGAALVTAAGSNKVWQSEVVSWVQQAAPYVNTFQQAKDWIDKNGGSLKDLQKTQDQVTISTDNLTKNAAKYTAMLQNDLTPGEVAAAKASDKVTTAIGNYTDSLIKSGDKSAATKKDRQDLIDQLLKAGVNAQDASKFVNDLTGFTENLGKKSTATAAPVSQMSQDIESFRLSAKKIINEVAAPILGFLTPAAHLVAEIAANKVGADILAGIVASFVAIAALKFTGALSLFKGLGSLMGLGGKVAAATSIETAMTTGGTTAATSIQAAMEAGGTAAAASIKEAMATGGTTAGAEEAAGETAGGAKAGAEEAAGEAAGGTTAGAEIGTAEAAGGVKAAGEVGAAEAAGGATAGTAIGGAEVAGGAKAGAGLLAAEEAGAPALGSMIGLAIGAEIGTYLIEKHFNNLFQQGLGSANPIGPTGAPKQGPTTGVPFPTGTNISLNVKVNTQALDKLLSSLGFTQTSIDQINKLAINPKTTLGQLDALIYSLGGTQNDMLTINNLLVKPKTDPTPVNTLGNIIHNISNSIVDTSNQTLKPKTDPNALNKLVTTLGLTPAQIQTINKAVVDPHVSLTQLDEMALKMGVGASGIEAINKLVVKPGTDLTKLDDMLRKLGLTPQEIAAVNSTVIKPKTDPTPVNTLGNIIHNISNSIVSVGNQTLKPKTDTTAVDALLKQIGLTPTQISAVNKLILKPGDDTTAVDALLRQIGLTPTQIAAVNKLILKPGDDTTAVDSLLRQIGLTPTQISAVNKLILKPGSNTADVDALLAKIGLTPPQIAAVNKLILRPGDDTTAVDALLTKIGLTPPQISAVNKLILKPGSNTADVDALLARIGLTPPQIAAVNKLILKPGSNTADVDALLAKIGLTPPQISAVNKLILKPGDDTSAVDALLAKIGLTPPEIAAVNKLIIRPQTDSGPINTLITDVSNLNNSLTSLPKTVTSTVQVVMSAVGGITVAASGLAAQAFKIATLNRGGKVPGTGSGDTVPAWIQGEGPALLEPGEVVVPKAVVASGAIDNLRGKLPGFAAGGLVGAAPWANQQAESWLQGESGRWVQTEDQSFIASVKKAVAAAAAAASAAAGAIGNAVSGSSNANLVTIAKYLMANGASKAGAAGITSTIAGESVPPGNPESVGSGGWGLIGWTGNTVGLPPGVTGPTGNATKDLNDQMAGVIGYARAKQGSWPGQFGTATDPVQAGQAWSILEAPLVQYSDTRPAIAQQLFAQGLASGGAVGKKPPLRPPISAPHVTVSSYGAQVTWLWLLVPSADRYALWVYGRGGRTLWHGVISGRAQTLGIYDQASVEWEMRAGNKAGWGPLTPRQTYHILYPAVIPKLGATATNSLSGTWNALSAAAFASEKQLGTDYASFLKSYTPSATKAQEAGFLSLSHLQAGEAGAWNALAKGTGSPLAQTSSSYTNMAATLKNYHAQLAHSLITNARGLDPQDYAAMDIDITAKDTGLLAEIDQLGALWAQLYGPAGVINPKNMKTAPGATVMQSNTHWPSPNFRAPGFADGGLVPGYSSGGYVGLDDLLGKLSLMPAIGYGRIGTSGAIGAVNSAVSAPSEPRRGRSEAAQATVGGQGSNVSFGDVIVNYPRPEAASTSITRAVQKAAWLAGRHLSL